jgi:hypothetical protein
MNDNPEIYEPTLEEQMRDLRQQQFEQQLEWDRQRHAMRIEAQERKHSRDRELVLIQREVRLKREREAKEAAQRQHEQERRERIEDARIGALQSTPEGRRELVVEHLDRLQDMVLDLQKKYPDDQAV